MPPISQVADLIRLTHNFSLSEAGSKVEQAEISTWWKSADVPTFSTDWDAVLQEMAGVGYERWNHFVNATFFHTSVSLDNVKATHTNTDGTIQQEQVAVATGGDQWTGTSSTGSLPWQTSLVVSLYSYTRFQFVPNARRRRGRVYMPPMDSGVLADSDSGLLNPTDMATFVGGYGLFLDAVQTHTYTAFSGFEPVPGVNSRGPFKGTGVAPEFFPITEISYDTKLDTQRRRTKRLNSVIATAPYPPS